MKGLGSFGLIKECLSEVWKGLGSVWLDYGVPE